MPNPTGHCDPLTLGRGVVLLSGAIAHIGTSMKVKRIGALTARDAERPAAVLISTIIFAPLLLYVLYEALGI